MLARSSGALQHQIAYLKVGAAWLVLHLRRYEGRWRAVRSRAAGYNQAAGYTQAVGSRAAGYNRAAGYTQAVCYTSADE